MQADGRDGAEEHARGSRTDALGIAVLVGCATWSLIAAAGRPARPEGLLLALLAVTAGYATGRIAGALLPVAAPAGVALAIVGATLVMPGRLSGDGTTPPLGYPNADAALLVLATGAACCAAWSATAPPLRLALRLLGAGAGGLALAIGSTAGFAASVGVMLCSLAAARMRRRLLALVGFALAAAIAVGGTYAVAADALPPGLSASLTGQLTAPRVALWHDAVGMARDHPVRGVGPDRFRVARSSALTSVEGPPTPQSAAFQVAAEQGLPGVALLAAAFAWVLCTLWRSPRATPVVLSAGAALTGLAMLAAVDHVLSYAVVTAAAGILAGLAAARPLPE
ncbi:O-antigen ligase family protein [Streptomyces sp. H10-C2]|uniref:O-antigen ligase family protein n=1 Tax=unclassified Streptomyces TaxID=2593676 RepID=UPI0024B912BF|nr:MULTISPECIES: O-antigen ligase family protein [unclassified Streptomyces]MDJ0342867.1 O-antigen ligase family protein [Streptomyces sp. PH10-H1]MDJ0372640.1 O-antigen ligase family protein [Streptomyces sp. H10-C2]